MNPVEAMQQALAAEHACIYGYGVALANGGSQHEAALQAALDTHREQRDRLRQMLIDAGVEASALTPAAPAYELGDPVESAADAVALAGAMERRSLGSALELVRAAGDASGDEPDAQLHRLRRIGASHLAGAAERAADWGVDPGPLPGYSAGTGG